MKLQANPCLQGASFAKTEDPYGYWELAYECSEGAEKAFFAVSLRKSCLFLSGVVCS